jgi:hypothetical protein
MLVEGRFKILLIFSRKLHDFLKMCNIYSKYFIVFVLKQVIYCLNFMV